MKTILFLILATFCFNSKCADQPNDSRILTHLTFAHSFDHFNKKISDDRHIIDNDASNVKTHAVIAQMKALDLTKDPRSLAFTILIDSSGEKLEIRKFFGIETFETESPTINGDSKLIFLQKHIGKALAKGNCRIKIVADNTQAFTLFSTAVLKAIFNDINPEIVDLAMNITKDIREQHTPN